MAKTGFFLETDYMDDPRRPGAVLGPKTVPKRTQQLLAAGVDEEVMWNTHMNFHPWFTGLRSHCWNLRGWTTSSHHIDERESTGTSVRAMLSTRRWGMIVMALMLCSFAPLATAQVPTAPGLKSTAEKSNRRWTFIH